MKIAISTDTTSTINLDLAKKLGIYVFPLNVYFSILMGSSKLKNRKCSYLF